MNMIVVGCGRVGAELAYRLYQKGHAVTVIDQTDAAFHNLPIDFRGRTVVGDVMNQDVLRRAGMEDAHGAAIVTSSDSVNAVIGHLARTIFGVPIVAVRNYDSRWRPLQEVFGLQMVSASSWGAQRIEELLYQQQTRTVFSAGNGEVELYEFAVPEAWSGRSLGELLPRQDCILAALTRAGRALLPDCDIELLRGDLILVSATLEGSEALQRQLRNAPGPGKAEE
ncbi:MAG: NAD-binding protein [Chloroflexota bacterium]